MLRDSHRAKPVDVKEECDDLRSSDTNYQIDETQDRCSSHLLKCQDSTYCTARVRLQSEKQAIRVRERMKVGSMKMESQQVRIC